MSEMDRVQLAIYMWANMDEAIGDLPKGPPSELFERFIRWTHSPRPAATPTIAVPGSARLAGQPDADAAVLAALALHLHHLDAADLGG